MGLWPRSEGSSRLSSRLRRCSSCSRPAGRPVAEIARELEVNEGTLGNWVNEWKRENPEPEKALTPVERARVAEMEDEIRRLRLENEFLKKAAAFFAKTQP